MAHGTPDYNITAGRQTTHQLTDLGELAVRLGSPIAFDRRGDVMSWDDFECATNRYDVSLDGLGAAVARSTERAHSGENSYKLTAGSTAGHGAGLIASEPAIVRSSVGHEILMNLPGTIEAFYIRMVHFDGVNLHRATLRWVDAANELTYGNAAGADVQFATGIDLPVNLPTWNAFKLVADFVSDRYVRAIVNNVTYDLSGIAVQVAADARAPRVDFTIQLFGRAGFNDIVYVDDVIVTQNEPV